MCKTSQCGWSIEYCEGCAVCVGLAVLQARRTKLQKGEDERNGLLNLALAWKSIVHAHVYVCVRV